MKVSFLAQPFPPFGGRMFDWLRERLVDSDLDHIQMVTAWVKRSGLSRLRSDLSPFRGRGGRVSAIVGIDEGGATVQGLQLARELFDDVRVLHDPASRTFHPKVYLASGASSAHLLVGSNNVTAGGLFSNYEGALVCQLDLTNSDDRALYDQVVSWFELLSSDTDVCKVLTEELLNAIVTDSRYQVGDEDRSRVARTRGEDYDGVTNDTSIGSIFGTSSIPKSRRAPAVSVAKPSTPRRPPAPPPPVPSPTTPSPASPTRRPPIAVPPLRWHKRLSASDAQQARTANTRVTGNLKLAKAGYPIDQRTYFRQQMFGRASWTATPTPRGTKEETTVVFDAVINGVSQGQHSLKIDHADYRIASQNNVPTWLHWGSLSPVLRATSYTGAWVVIERRADGSYRLEITRTAPGPAPKP